MIKDGLFTRFPKPDFVLAIHDSADQPVGQVGYAPGYALAAADSVDITIYGVGGHGGRPQNTRRVQYLVGGLTVFERGGGDRICGKSHKS